MGVWCVWSIVYLFLGYLWVGLDRLSWYNFGYDVIVIELSIVLVK